LRRGERIEHFETVRMTKDRRRIYVSLTVSPISDASGRLIAASAIGRDITEQKKEQEEKALLMAELERSLNQKHLLVQEVYHRVKNNLQIISSLLDLRSRYIFNDPKKARAAFEESIERIRAMSMVHEKLYSSGDLETLDFQGYLRSLIEQLFRTYALNKQIELTVEGDSIVFELNIAIPLGLIFNELITNSLKHAFNSNTGKIAIRCKAGDEMITLSYSDNGSGLADGVDFATSETFGFRIIRLLTKQINGKITVSSNDGTSFEITIPRADGVKDGSPGR
jgi:two-component sensor histidine kinase